MNAPSTLNRLHPEQAATSPTAQCRPDVPKRLEVSIDPEAKPPVNPELLPVSADTVISFRLTDRASRRYEFALDQPPVVVPEGGSSFGPALRLSDSLATLRDLHTIEGDFSYTINLIGRQSRLPVRIDPVIRNEQ